MSEGRQLSVRDAGSTSADLLTVKECAALLRVSRNSVYEAIRRDELPGVIRIGRLLRVSRRGLLEGLGLRTSHFGPS